MLSGVAIAANSSFGTIGFLRVMSIALADGSDSIRRTVAFSIDSFLYYRECLPELSITSDLSKVVIGAIMSPVAIDSTVIAMDSGLLTIEI